MAKLVMSGGEVTDFTYLKNLNSLEMPKIKERAKSAPRSTKTNTFIP